MNVTTLNIGIGANSSHPINSNAKIQTYHDYSVPNINPRSESNFHDYNAYTKNTLIYANRKYIEDFEEPNTILDDKMLLEVENLLYNSNHSVDGNASDKKRD